MRLARRIRGSLALLFLCSLLFGQTAPQPKKASGKSNDKSRSWSTAFEAWLDKLTGIPNNFLRNQGAQRSGSGWPRGRALVSAEVQDGSLLHESVIWDCQDCWSPLSLGPDRIAVTKDDGVWVVSTKDRKPISAEPIVRATDIRVLLALSQDNSSRIIVLRSDITNQYEYSTWLCDLDAGTISRYREPAIDEVLEFDFRELVRPQQVRNHLLVRNRDADDDPLRIAIYRLAEIKDGVLGTGTLLAAQRKEEHPASRFDPVWTGDGSIVYVVR